MSYQSILFEHCNKHWKKQYNGVSQRAVFEYQKSHTHHSYANNYLYLLQWLYTIITECEVNICLIGKYSITFVRFVTPVVIQGKTCRISWSRWVAFEIRVVYIVVFFLLLLYYYFSFPYTVSLFSIPFPVICHSRNNQQSGVVFRDSLAGYTSARAESGHVLPAFQSKNHNSSMCVYIICTNETRS